MIQLAKVEKAIEARLSADATLTALGPVFLSFVPEGQARPYVCVTVSLDNLDMLFGERNNVANLLITVEVYADRDGGVTTPQTMMDRVYGDESSYGLHRWTPTLEGKWLSDAIHLESVAPIHDEETLAYSMRFLMLQSDTKAPQLVSARFDPNAQEQLTLTFDQAMSASSLSDDSLVVHTSSTTYSEFALLDVSGSVVTLGAQDQAARTGTAGTLEWDGGTEIKATGGLLWPAVTGFPVTVT